MTLLRDDFDLPKLLSDAFLRPGGALCHRHPQEVHDAWAAAADSLGVDVQTALAALAERNGHDPSHPRPESADLVPGFWGKARWHFEQHHPPLGPGSPYAYPYHTKPAVRSRIAQAVAQADRGYRFGIETASKRPSGDIFVTELPPDHAPYLYIWHYRYATRGAPDQIDLSIRFHTWRDPLPIQALTGDFRSTRIVVPSDLATIIDRYVAAMATIDDHLRAAW